jgi:KUP system potassium uptake protein
VARRKPAGWKADTVASSRHTTGQAALTVGALGVVFGDIGTSPLYTVQTVFSPSDPHPVQVSTEHVFGIT